MHLPWQRILPLLLYDQHELARRDKPPERLHLPRRTPPRHTRASLPSAALHEVPMLRGETFFLRVARDVADAGANTRARFEIDLVWTIRPDGMIRAECGEGAQDARGRFREFAPHCLAV